MYNALSEPEFEETREADVGEVYASQEHMARWTAGLRNSAMIVSKLGGDRWAP